MFKDNVIILKQKQQCVHYYVTDLCTCKGVETCDSVSVKLSHYRPREALAVPGG